MNTPLIPDAEWYTCVAILLLPLAISLANSLQLYRFQSILFGLWLGCWPTLAILVLSRFL